MSFATSASAGTILIVENEILIAMDLECRLKKFGYQISGRAMRGLEALELVKLNQPDLILMDIALQGEMDGIETAAIIRDQWGLPIVFLSAHTEADRLKRAQLTNPFGYLLKPFQDRDLQITIEMALYTAKMDAARKKAEEDLRLREQDLVEAQKLARLGSWRYDPETGQPEWSEEMFHIFGLDPSQGAPSYQEYQKLIHPGDWEMFDAAVSRAVQTGSGYTLDLRILRPDGAMRHIVSSCQTHQNGEGRVIKIIGTAQDITERKKVEETVRANEVTLRAVMNANIEAALLIDPQGRTLALNLKAAQSLGKNENKIIGSCLYDLLPPDIAAFKKVKVEEVITTRTPLSFEDPSSGKTILNSLIPILDSQGRVSKVGLFGLDFQDRENAEDQAQKKSPNGKDIKTKLKTILQPAPLMDDVVLADVLDSALIQSIMDDFFRLTKISVAILDIAGNILVATGWQDICTKFHRINSKTARHCLESDTILSSGVPPGEFKLYRCRNNMWDLSTPIMVGGKHMGNLYLGQFFFEGEELDRDLFRRQARKYGFDEEEYMAALDRVPRWDSETVTTVMKFYIQFANILSSLGHSNLHLARTLIEKDTLINRIGESEEKYRLLVENAEESILVAQEGRIRFANPKTMEIIGYSKEELTSLPFTDFIHPEDRDIVSNKHFKRMQHNSAPASYEFRIVCRSGEIRWAELKVVRIQWEGAPATLNFLSDITQRKETEKQLRVSEERYRTAYEHAEKSLQESGQRANEITALLKASQALLKFRGFPESAQALFDICHDLIGASSGYIALFSENEKHSDTLFLEPGTCSLIHYSDLPPLLQEMGTQSGKTGKTTRHNALPLSESRAFIPDGKTPLDNLVLSPLKIGDHIAGIMGLMNKKGDFTDHDARLAGGFGEIAAVALRNSHLQDQIESSEFRFRELFSTMSSGVLICQPAMDEQDFTVLDINRSGEHFLGLNRERVLGQSISKVLPAALIPKLGQAMTRVDKSGVPEDFSISLLEDHRVSLWTESNVYRLPNRELVVIFDDLTDKKRAEQEKISLEIQLQQAHKMEAVGTLAGGVAHDFNNLLQAINGYTQILLMDRNQGDPDLPTLKAIETAGERAAQLIQQLLIFSRKMESERRAVDLNQVVVQSRGLLERIIPKMITIEFQPGKTLWATNGDPIQLEQILLNLGSNAADAMPEGGRLTIKTENVFLEKSLVPQHLGMATGKYVLLTISDTGLGMDKETLAHIFEPFFTTKEIGKGTGLGLASVYGIVKNHEGHITCHSKPGQGTAFQIYLPAVLEIKQEESPKETEKYLQGGTETILLVDDEELIRELGSEVLKRFGYRVVTACCGEEALDRYSKSPQFFDLVILDIGMPGMGGYKCLEEIVRINPEVKVLVASGYSGSHPTQKVLNAGASGYVGKPYQLNSLLHAVRQVLNRV